MVFSLYNGIGDERNTKIIFTTTEKELVAIYTSSFLVFRFSMNNQFT